ncbi:MAG: orotidine-5'-phosphate decarboxylase [Bacillus sp. (in: firmicutes)]
MKNSLIIALDFSSIQEVTEFLDLFEGERLFVKVGMELFYSQGPEVVEAIKARGHRVFLDLKLHDIPNTVRKAMMNLARLDVDLVNVHAAGGKRMMEAALQGLTEGTESKKSRPYLIAVTQLTSTTEEEMQADQNIMLSLEESVLSYAKSAYEAGLDGVVCSTYEAEKIHGLMGPSFLTVTPGIRMADNQADDQRRIATPEKARLLGADAIVVGRAITAASSPVEAYRRIVMDWEGTALCK